MGDYFVSAQGSMDVLGLLKDKFTAWLQDPATAEKMKALREAQEAEMIRLRETNTMIVSGFQTIQAKEGVHVDTLFNQGVLMKDSTQILQGSSLTPEELGKKNEEFKTRQTELITKAETEAKEAADAKQKQLEEEKRAQEEEQQFSLKRMFQVFRNRMMDAFWQIGLAILALLGGSLASNAARFSGVRFRLFQLIQGTVLFPFSQIAAIKNWLQYGKTPRFYAILAPLQRGSPGTSVAEILLYPFVQESLTEDMTNE